MNKQSLILYITLAILFLNTTFLFGQCVVCVEAPSLITCGETATLTGDGFLTTAGFSDNFNSPWNSAILWANISAGGSTTSPCTGGSSVSTINCAGAGSVPAGDFLWWGQGAAVPRQAATIAIPVPAGGDIIFEFKMEGQGGSCDGPDLIGEGIMLQYRVGPAPAIWQDVTTTMWPFNLNPMPYTNKAYFCPTNPALQSFTSWNQYSIPIPALAFSANTNFRWRQISPTNQNWDFWGLDNVNIVPSSPGGATYTWTPGGVGQTITVSPTSLTNYMFTYTNNGISCSTTVAVDVSPPIVNPIIIPNPLQPCPNLVDLSADASFNTCNYNIYLYDNGGNGWTTVPQTTTSIDNRIEVYVDGVLVNTITMNNGYGPFVYSFPVTAGGTFETVFLTGGPNPSECAYFVEDNQGQLITDVGGNIISAMGLSTSPSSPFWPVPAGIPPSPGFVVVPGDFGPVGTVCPTTNTYNYSWSSFPLGSTAGIGTPNSPTTTVTSTPGPQDFEVCIQDQSNFGCIDCEVITVPGNPGIGTFEFAIPSNPICDDGTPVTFDLSSTTIPAGNFSFDFEELDALGGVINTTPYVFPIWMGSGSPFSFTLPNPGAGTYTYQISNLVDGSGCSIAVINSLLILTVAQQGNPGTSSTINFCPNDPTSYDLSTYIAPVDPGGNWTLAGIPLPNGSLFDPLTNVAGVYTYTIANAPCPAISATVTVSFFTLPPAPTATNETVCEGAVAIPDLTATGTNLTWYDHISLAPANQVGTGTSFATLQTAQGTYTYYVTETSVDLCEGPATTVTLEIFPTPTAPAAIDGQICFGLPTPDLTATGTNLTWYDNVALTPANQVGTGTSFATGQTIIDVYTYYVTETNLDGCEGPATIVTLEIFTLPAAPSATDETACVGDAVISSLTAIGTNLTWYDNPALAPANQVGTGTSFATGETTIGVYTYYVTETSGCEGPATTVTLEIFAIPTAPTTTDEDICFGFPIPDLTATGTNLTWYDNPALAPANQVGVGNSFPTLQTTVGTYTYYVTQTNADGCEGPSATATLEIFTLPPAPAATDEDICFGFPIPDLTATGTNLTWYDDISLAPANQVGTGISFATLQTAVGTYTYYVTQTNADGCEGPANPVTLEIFAIPAAPTATPVEICFQLPTPALTATGTNLTWYDDPALAPANQVGTGTSFATGQTVVGVYTYYVTQTTNGCESAASTVTLTIHPEPIIFDFTANPTTIAQGNPIDLIVEMAVGGTPPFTINIVDDDIPSNSFPLSIPIPNMIGTVSTAIILPLISPNVTPITNYSITSVTDGNGCTNPSGWTVPVTVDPYPIIDPFNTADNEFCYGTIIPSINMTLYQGQVPVTVNYTYNGVTTDEIIGTVGIPVNIPLDTAELNIGTNTIIINSVTDNSGDASPSNLIPNPVVITVHPTPIVTFGQDDVICFEEEDAILEFDFLVGTEPFDVEYTINTIAQPPLSFSANGTQTYTLTPNPAVGDNTYNMIQVTDDNGCLSAPNTTLPVTIRVNPTPELGITVKNPNPICVGDTSALFFPVTTLFGPAPSDPYTLDYLSGTTLSTVIVDAGGYIVSTGTTHPIFPIITTDYTLVSVVDNNGCSDTLIDSDQLVVNELPSVNISGDAEICRQDVTKLYFNVNAGSSPWEVYYNINGTPDSITLYNSTDSITLSPTITTIYAIDSITDILCSSPIIDAATITVNQLPEIEVSGGGSVCNDGSEINVIITTTSGTPTFNIEYTVGIDSRLASNIGYEYIINTNEAGTYSVTKATDSKDCIAQSITGNATVNINPMPEANIIAYPQPANIDNPVIYFIDESILHVNGVWDFGYFGSYPDTTLANGDKINHTFPDTGTYTVALEVMTDSGCVITAYQTIIIDQAFKIYIPTAFTPNNDLYNDYFLPIVDGVQEYNLKIYDRFGGTVFMTEKTNEAWDGKQKNGIEYAIAGNYVYDITIIDFKGKGRTYQGAFTLIR